MAQSVVDALAITKSAVPLTLVFDEDDPGFTVESADATAALSESFDVTMRVRHARSDLEPEDLVASKARLRLDEQPDFAFTGMISRARFLSAASGTALYELVLSPRTHWMSLRRDHRIFKNMKATDMAIEVAQPLVDRVGSIIVFDDSTLPEHEYRVQYGESDLTAMTRLLAEDGVTYLFNMHHDCDLLLIPDTLGYVGDEVTLPFVGATALQVDGKPAATRVTTAACEVVRGIQLRDHWMTQPEYEPKVSTCVADCAEDPLETYDFDAQIEDTDDELARQVQIRHWELLSRSRPVEVTSNRFVQPGTTLTIERSPIAEGDKKLRVVSVRSKWSAGSTARGEHVLGCMPYEHRWVPSRIAKRAVAGIQKAFVVGEGEIDSDEYGRVLCRFVWDRKKTVTRRVEVSQAWAGMGYGAFSQPRVGEQVLVAYIDGDPDEPVVVGRVHNGKNLPPVKLPADEATSTWRTKSTPNSDGYNEIRMKDDAGEELISIHAQLDLDTIIERDGRAKCGRDFTFEVARHTNMKVKGLTTVQCSSPARWEGVDLSLDASNSLMINVGSYRSDHCGGHWDQSAKSIAVTTEGDETHLNGGLFKVEAPHIFHSAFGTFVSVKPGNITLSCGGSSIVMTPGKITIVSPLIELNP